jgi:small subunit ribosomal protein S7
MYEGANGIGSTNFEYQPRKSRNTKLSVVILSIDIKGEELVPRRGKVPKREVLADPLYKSVLVSKLINSIMLDGKKGVAQKVVYDAFSKIEEKSGKPALEVFTKALDNIMPSLEVKARRVGGATYQVPIEVRPDRRQTLGLRWLTNYSRARNEKTMKDRLAGEILDASNNAGSSVKRREDMHKMAESNKAFAHFRW